MRHPGMRWTMMAAAVAWAAPAWAAERAAPPPLQPSGKWTVEFATNMCVLQRSFGEGRAMVSIGFRPIPLSDQAEFLVLRPSRDFEHYRRGKGQVSIDGQAISAGYESYYIDRTHQRLATYYGDVGIDAVLAAQAVTIAGDGSGPVAVAPHGTPGARAVVDRCQDDLLKSWGVDLTVLRAAVVPAVPVRPLHSHFSPMDYPAEALAAHEGGRVLALMTVGADGAVTACRAAVPATPALDRATCQVLTQRARFTPARDAAGRPIATWRAAGVRWVMP